MTSNGPTPDTTGIRTLHCPVCDQPTGEDLIVSHLVREHPDRLEATDERGSAILRDAAPIGPAVAVVVPPDDVVP